MKIKFILLALATAIATTNASAQNTNTDAQKNDKNFFNHLSVGVNAGTPGFGVDVAMPVCDYVQIRAGVSIFPKIKVNTELDTGLSDSDMDITNNTGYFIPNEVKIEGKTGFTNGKVLLDIYPIKSMSLHITAGAYFGSSKIVEAYNEEDGALKAITNWNKANPNNIIGVELGNYLLTPDENGNVNAEIKTASFKPYLGIGFGRAVPKKNRLGFMFELGCQFWGSPKLYCNGTELSKDNVDGDAGDALKVLSKISVYPVLNFRICGRIF